MASSSPASTAPSPPPAPAPATVPAAASEPHSSSAETTPPPPKQPPPQPKPEAPLPDSKASADASVVLVPSHSRWFSLDSIHECEVRHLPEFFDSASSSSKTPRVYKYYRNSIVKYFRYNPSRKITFTDVRKTLVGDVGSIRRVFDFLEAWGLINYHPSSSQNKPLKWDDKDSKNEAGSNSNETPPPIRETTKRICSGCKAVCTIACFACDKYDLTLCARCYVRGNYRVGVSSSDFKRVEISEETKTDWSEKETLNLVEAITHYGDDWKKVAQHVGGRTEKDCVAQFIKLPFGDQFLRYQGNVVSDDSGNQLKKDAMAEGDSGATGSAEPSKRMRLTPLADASNPIMAQAAFLSALVGSEVAQAAAQAAVTTLSEVYKPIRIYHRSFPRNTSMQEAGIASNGGSSSDSSQVSRLHLHATTQLEKEESDVEKAISEIIEVQMKNIQDKLVRFQDSDLLIEKECQQLEQMRNMLFLDQLSLLFHKQSTQKSGECA